ncbi:MAG: VCBS repeat-containing protein, partial [Acidobacteria bacterium]|nr:VCBS repeat-containing protein [Acidobacteriota bacterium]
PINSFISPYSMAGRLMARSVSSDTCARCDDCRRHHCGPGQGGLEDVLACDMPANRVGWVRQHPAGVYSEKWIGPVLPAPARVSVHDMDNDGRPDFISGRMNVYPPFTREGRIMLRQNHSGQTGTR